jgi:TPR repeat protein
MFLKSAIRSIIVFVIAFAFALTFSPFIKLVKADDNDSGGKGSSGKYFSFPIPYGIDFITAAERGAEYYFDDDPSNDEEAMAYLKLASDNDVFYASRLICLKLVNLGSEKDEIEEGLKFCHKGADGGDTLSAYYLGLVYNLGFFFPYDEQKAYDLFKQAEKDKHPGAFYELSQFYLKGKIVRKSVSKYKKLLKKAADAGHNTALFELGKNYYLGENFKQNRKKGLELILKAKEGGHAGADDFLEKIAAEQE